MRALLPLLCLALIGGLATPSLADPARVKTEGGMAIGFSDGTVASFKGLPYAAPPVGPLRWRRTQPAPAWAGERDASDFGPSCPQPEVPHTIPEGSRARTQSEDCLTLNVWAPANVRKAPVMVWLHGGGNQNGGSADRYMDGTAMARDGVVLVSLNYRLGLLGFLALPELTRQGGEVEANFGLWDQIEALKWVRRNIAAFGGDPDNVTLFGESAGGEDIRALMASPMARGLFGKAVIESGGGGWDDYPTVEAAGMAGTLKSVGLPTDVAALRALPAERLAAAARWDASLVVDGVMLPRTPLKAFAEGKAMKIPLIIGTNQDEGAMIDAGSDPATMFPKLTAADVEKLRGFYGLTADQNDALARRLFRDGYFVGPSHWIARTQSAHGAPAWPYRFDYIAGALRTRRTSVNHGSEIPFVFGTLARPDDADTVMSAAMRGCWIAFARTGRPDCPAGVDWKPGDGAWMVFDAKPGPRQIGDAAALGLLEAKLKP